MKKQFNLEDAEHALAQINIDLWKIHSEKKEIKKEKRKYEDTDKAKEIEEFVEDVGVSLKKEVVNQIVK